MSSQKTPKNNVQIPSDPDPTPIASSRQSEDVTSVAREERKRVASSYGRTKTILAGNSAQNNANKKTILGG